MNRKALAKVRKKTESCKRYLETREGRDYELYCKARNQARRATRQAMKQFEKEVANNAKTNPKTFHKYVNSKTKVRTGIGELQVDDVTSISDEEKASTLNKYFSSVYTKEDTTRIPTCENHAVRTPCPRIQLSRDDVYRELQALNPTKSAGPDNLYPIVLKETASTIYNCWPTFKDFSTFVRHRRGTGSMTTGQRNTYLQEGKPQGTWQLQTHQLDVHML